MKRLDAATREKRLKDDHQSAAARARGEVHTRELPNARVFCESIKTVVSIFERRLVYAYARIARSPARHWRLRRYGWYASSFGSTQAEKDTKLTNPSSSLNLSATASMASSPSSLETCARTTCLNCALVT